MIRSKGEKVFDVFNVVFMVLLALMFVLPALLIVCASFTSASAFTKYGYSLIIHEFSLSSYKYIFAAQDLFLRSMINSVFMTAMTVIISTVTTCLYAYAVTRKQLLFKKFFNIVLVISMLFAGGTIPYYLVINGLGLMNTQWAIILPMGVNAWHILLVKNFFAALPESLTEAAQLEGASNVKVLFKVVVPIGFPIIATIILYTAVGVWNDWFQAALFLDSNHRELWPVQALVRELESDIKSIAGSLGSESLSGYNPEGIKAAAVVVSTIPIILVYPFLQRYFINGVLIGSVKE